MRARIVIVVVLCGCNRLFDLSSVSPQQQQSDAAPALAADAFASDALVLLMPPDGGMTCGPQLDFTHWTYDTVASPSLSIQALALYPMGPGDAAMFAGQDTLIDDAFHVFDWDLSGTPVPITPLDPMMGEYTSLGLSPDANILWLSEATVDEGTYLATRASSWARQRIDFGLSDPDPQVGAVGYYNGTARMVVAVNPGQTGVHLIELSSRDGVTWSVVPGTFDTTFEPFIGVNTPSLTADGCTLVFSGVTPEYQFYLWVAYRNDDETFAPPVQIEVPGQVVGALALSTDQTSLWFIADGNLMRGHP